MHKIKAHRPVLAAIFLLLMEAAQSASAADWARLVEDVSGRTWFIGRVSSQAESGIVSAWVRMEFQEKAEAPTAEWMLRPAAGLSRTYYSLLLLEFDFSDKSYRQVALYSYGPDGRHLGSNVIPSGWEYIIPDTIAETIYSTLKRWLNR